MTGIATEWKDDAWATKFNSLLLLITIIGAYSIYVIMPDQQTIAMGYLLMGILVTIAGAVDTGNENHPTLGAQGVGSKSKALMGAIVGAALGFVLTGFQFSITPLAVAGTLGWTYVVVLSPVLEEMFFRGVLLPTMGKLLPGILAFVGQAAIFGSWHFVAYGGDTNAMLAAGLFGLLAAALNFVFKSLAPSLALHIVYNWGVIQ